MNNAALAAGAIVAFAVNNTSFADGDVAIVNIASGEATQGTYSLCISAAQDNFFIVTLQNISTGSLSEALIIAFSVIKGVSA